MFPECTVLLLLSTEVINEFSTVQTTAVPITIRVNRQVLVFTAGLKQTVAVCDESCLQNVIGLRLSQ